MRSNTTADPQVRTTDGEDCCDERPVRRATRIARLLKLLATTLGALAGAAKALGLV